MVACLCMSHADALRTAQKLATVDSLPVLLHTCFLEALMLRDMRDSCLSSEACAL